MEIAAQTAPSGVRLLVVDDDPRVRRAIANAMSRAGFHVFAAEDGGPALTIAEQTPPDLAIVDFNMPTPGLEVVRKLKKLHGAAIWIAVLSGQDDEETRTVCFDAGADDVMAKPAMIAELKRRMVAAARTQQAYVETRLAQERADRLLAYGAEAAAMLAHDLNNGLAVALGNMVYLHGVVTLGEDETAALTATVTALRRMSGLVANFVDIARFEDAAVKPSCTSNNVRALLHEVIDVHSVVPNRRVRFEVDCDPALLGHFDTALVERVLHNLVGNAARYCNDGGTIRLTAHRWDQLDGSSVELSVFNTGPAVPDKLRERLFAKYAKGSNGKRGFGLYFCRLACEAHGGTIDYVASPEGSTFWIRLPGR
ncbi:MAG: hybrid sensor histidine kinase/response regulator [Deltaproteobacteria bacterium]|nr:hybrid sensor histidine kinase/response regulator [Deltaproteobacteria bacterium]